LKLRTVRPTMLLVALLALGCGRAPLQGIGNTVALEGVEAQSRPVIGGPNYSNFHISPELPKANGPRAATKLTYLMTDEANHQSVWSAKMLAMMGQWNSHDVHNVVFRDGMEMDDSRLYYLTGGAPGPTGLRAVESLLAPGVKEVQSNNPMVFSQIVGYTFEKYPAKRRYMQLYTHGGGVFGVGCDEKQTDLKGKLLADDQKIGIMRMPAFAEAMRQGLKGRQLDLMYFRACLMGNVEALYEIADTTRFVCSSEEVSDSTTNSNMTMTQLYEDLAEKDIEPAELARQLAIAAHAKHPSTPTDDDMGYQTFAAFDLSKMKGLHSAIDHLAVTLLAAMPTDGKGIVAAYDGTPTYNGKPKPTVYYEQDRDLWAFTASLLHGISNPAILAAASQVRAAQSALMIHEKDNYGSASNGLSIFMPARSDVQPGGQMQPFLTGGYLKTRFAQSSAWTKFLNAMAAAK
jgi:hypothetical protein